ncbi:MAG: DNA-3-methyladenine glycosylase I [Nitrospinaceae bacterium]
MNKNVEVRCSWTGQDPLMVEYHDKEWGVPVHDDRTLFEFLILEGAQAGLSWSTVLKKRQNFRRAFDHFDPPKISRYGEKDKKRLLADAGIIRNRLKIDAAISNARSYLKVQDECDSFHRYIWQFVGGKPIKNKFKSLSAVPAISPESEAMSKDLKKRGFRFVGPAICYAFMQAVGMVNDHTVDCFRHGEV